jgi:hypothetical protein
VLLIGLFAFLTWPLYVALGVLLVCLLVAFVRVSPVAEVVS